MIRSACFLRRERALSRLFEIAALVLGALTLQSALEPHAFDAGHSLVDSDGPISVDARHGGQDAHVEHSELQPLTRCLACVLSGTPRAALGERVGALVEPARFGRLVLPNPRGSTEFLGRLSRSRAPPLPRT